MVAYSFKSFFAPQIEAGIKTQTIRADRRRHARPGEMIQLFTGMRTKHCRKIRPDVVCVSVEPIFFEISDRHFTKMRVGDHWLFEDGREELARADGFAPEHYQSDLKLDSMVLPATQLMCRFWIDNNHAGTFEGVLIRWSAT